MLPNACAEPIAPPMTATILCECGCGQQAPALTNMGKPRRFIYGHQGRALRSTWKGGRSETGLYITVLAERDGKRRHQLEHIVLAEKALGRRLPRGVHVHHVNENKHDNSPGNLVICENGAYHKLLHRRRDALLACGDASARKCCRCLSYEDQADIRVTRGGQAYHKSCHARYQRLLKRAKRARSV